MTQKKEAFYSVRKIALDLLIEIMEKEAFVTNVCIRH